MSTLTRCLAYLAKLPPAISGQGGHRATFRAACEIVRFGLPPAEEEAALAWWNAHRCNPPWEAKELAHKMTDARAVARHGERGPVPQRPRLTQAEVEAMRRARRVALGAPPPPVPQSPAPVPQSVPQKAAPLLQSPATVPQSSSSVKQPDNP